VSRRALLALVAVLLLAGCASSLASPLPPHAGPPPPTTTTAVPPTSSTTSLSTTMCKDPTPSLRPLQPMPAPGVMPPGSLMDTILKRGYLEAGVSGDTYGFGYVDPATLTLQGFDVDVLRQVAQAIFGRNDTTVLHLVPITIPQVVSAINGGKVDIVAHTMTITCARRTQLDFSSEYLLAHQRLLVGLNSNITTLAQLAGQRVCAAAGTTSISRIASLAPRAIPVPVASETDCLVRFQTGSVDAISTDDTILDGMAKQDPYSRVVGPDIAPEPYGLAINLGHPEFTRFVDGILERIRTDGTLAKLYTQALGTSDVPLPPPPSYRA
jgi:polar amino acid transport system substrate-binding protein